MITLLFWLILSFADVMIPYLIYCSFAENENDKKIVFGLYFISVILNIIDIHFWIIQLILLLLLILSNTEKRAGMSYLYILLIFAAFHLFSILVCHLIVSSFTNMPFTIDEILEINSYSHLVYKCILAFLLITFLNIKVVTNNKLKVIQYKLHLTILLMGITLCLLLVQSYYKEVINTKIIHPFIGGVFLYLIFIIFSFFKETLKTENEKEKIKQEYVLNKIQLDNLMENYNHYEHFQKYKHDIKNNLITLQYLQENNDYEKAKDYLSQLVGKFEKVSLYAPISQHAIVNAIMADRTYKNRHIKFNVQCKISKKIFIDDLDLNILLVNLIDNAIEYLSSHDIKNKEIKIKFIEHGNLCFLSIANSIEENFSYDKDFKTTKKDKVNHGYGISIVKEVIHKYSGNIDFKIENRNYIVEVILKE